MHDARQTGLLVAARSQSGKWENSLAFSTQILDLILYCQEKANFKTPVSTYLAKDKQDSCIFNTQLSLLVVVNLFVYLLVPG